MPVNGRDAQLDANASKRATMSATDSANVTVVGLDVEPETPGMTAKFSDGLRSRSFRRTCG